MRDDFSEEAKRIVAQRVGSPMLWLLVIGVNVPRWEKQASAAGMRT